MKKFMCLALVLSMNISFASANDAVKAGLKVRNAEFNAKTDSVEVEISYKGGCQDNYDLRLRGCSDFIFPHACQVDVVLDLGDESCSEDMHGRISFSRSELGMKTRKFSQAKLTIQDPSKKSSASIVLPINK